MTQQEGRCPSAVRIVLVDHIAMLFGLPSVSSMALLAVSLMSDLSVEGYVKILDDWVSWAREAMLYGSFFLIAVARVMFVKRIFARGERVVGHLKDDVQNNDMLLSYSYKFGERIYRSSSLLLIRAFWGNESPVTIVVDPDRPRRSFIEPIFLPDSHNPHVSG